MPETKSYLTEIHYYRIPVTDLDVAVQWYVNVLGVALRVQRDDLAVFVIGEGPLLVAVKADADSKGHLFINGQAEFSVGFICPEIHAFRSYLISQDVRVEEIREEEGHFYFQFFDPFGNKLQAHW